MSDLVTMMRSPFGFNVSTVETKTVEQPGADITISSVTLLEGKEALVYLTEPAGDVCLARLIYPHCVNSSCDIRVPDSMKIRVDSADANANVAICVYVVPPETDISDLEMDDSEIECEYEASDDVLPEGMTIEEIEEPKSETVRHQVQSPKPEVIKTQSKDQMKKRKEKGEEKKKGDKQPEKKAVKPGIKKQLPHGLNYEIMSVGKGPEVTSGKKISVTYVGTLTDGKRFDAGTLSFRVGAGEVVQGFDKGVQGMMVGEKRRLYVPSKLGYGSNRAGTIPPNSDIVFEVIVNKIF